MGERTTAELEPAPAVGSATTGTDTRRRRRLRRTVFGLLVVLLVISFVKLQARATAQ